MSSGRLQTWRKPGMYNMVGMPGILGKMSGVKAKPQYVQKEQNNTQKPKRIEKLRQPQSIASATSQELKYHVRESMREYYQKKNLEMLEQKVDIKKTFTIDMKGTDMNMLPHRKLGGNFQPPKVTVTGDSESTPLRPVTSFSSLRKVSSTMLVGGLQQIWKDPTPVQSYAWTSLLADRDTVLLSPPGTGKSAAYLVPCIIEAARHKKNTLQAGAPEPPQKPAAKTIKTGIVLRPRVLIIVPTVELAVQLQKIGSHLSNPCGVLTGQIATPSGAIEDDMEILISTPEAVRTFSKKKQLDWSNMKTVVIDEADTFLGTKTMSEQIETLLMRIGGKTQRVLAASSWRSQSGEAALRILQDPIMIRVEEVEQLQRVQQRVHVVAPKSEAAFLAGMFSTNGLPTDKRQKYIVFCGDVQEACLVHDMLQTVLPSEKVVLLHDNLMTYQRISAIDHMNDQSSRVLVCTDIVSRGIDFSNVNVVVNYGIPEIPETLYQRIGRTARVDRYGAVHTIVSSSTPRYLLQMIKSFLKDDEITEPFYDLIRSDGEISSFVRKQQQRAISTSGIDGVF
eukprot:TRINITY_DN11166_c0_g1_i1.p1 TRINITY_DN11166_c0_g1~~TRINITY_DN11166_c0_g1_i1.p1  ORF type:complete len:564 (+),score=101.30 TRINITY_DN11166_c0_g1_i1:63-1754(+)